ncbi:MAG: hypothetical protein AAF394_06005 [Planctomycetota bacterium]
MRRTSTLFVCLLFSSIGFTALQAQERERSTRSQPQSTEKKTDFKPATEREKILVEMIDELRREVAALRRELTAMREHRPAERTRDIDRAPSSEQNVGRDMPREGMRRDGGRSDIAPREKDGPSAEALRDRPANNEREATPDRAKVNTKIWNQAKRIFAAYDKNKDGFASFEEWLQMREGEMTDERRERERKHFAAPAGKDSKITQEEFYRWMLSRQRGSRESD